MALTINILSQNSWTTISEVEQALDKSCIGDNNQDSYCGSWAPFETRHLNEEEKAARS